MQMASARPWSADAAPAVTLGAIVLFVGKWMNGAAGCLREFSIPEPVV